ncbi:hypothetical protein [Kribbella sp. NPDC051718]|uniref:hypothetical protein n=1 Tax=Kribbella sp. NPDC051718 TaxID=3155168 RepID=UPI0034147877
MTPTKPPTERPLPNKQAILDRVLATPTERSAPKRTRPSWAVPAIACAAVAALVGAILIVPQTLKSGDPTITPATKPAPTEISLDLGPLSEAEIAQALRECPFMNGTPERVLHTRKVRSGWGDGIEWTIVREGRTPAKGYFIAPGGGHLTACVGRPGTDPAHDFRMVDFTTTFGPAPTAEELAKLPKGESFSSWHYDDGFRPKEGIMLEALPGKMWTTALWLRVPATVHRVRQRIVVDGKPQAWFSSAAVDGISFTQAWMQAPIRQSAVYTFDVQFLDSSARPVEIPGSTGATTVVRSGGMSFNRTYKNSDYLVN